MYCTYYISTREASRTKQNRCIHTYRSQLPESINNFLVFYETYPEFGIKVLKVKKRL